MRALMTRKSCTLGMRNAIQGNHLHCVMWIRVPQIVRQDVFLKFIYACSSGTRGGTRVGCPHLPPPLAQGLVLIQIKENITKLLATSQTRGRGQVTLILHNHSLRALCIQLLNQVKLYLRNFPVAIVSAFSKIYGKEENSMKYSQFFGNILLWISVPFDFRPGIFRGLFVWTWMVHISDIQNFP